MVSNRELFIERKLRRLVILSYAFEQQFTTTVFISSKNLISMMTQKLRFIFNLFSIKLGTSTKYNKHRQSSFIGRRLMRLASAADLSRQVSFRPCRECQNIWQHIDQDKQTLPCSVHSHCSVAEHTFYDKHSSFC